MDKIVKSFVEQQEQRDCGVACLLSVIRFYGGNNTLKKLRDLSGTSRQGTTLLGLYQAANNLGFNAEGKKADLESLIKHNSPVILHIITKEKTPHYVVCYSYEKEKFIIGDPAKGIIKISQSQLKELWQTKTCLTLLPNEEFISTKDDNKQKKKWFLNLIKDDRRVILPSILFGIGIAVLGMVMAVFSQKLIDEILPSKDSNKLITGILLVFLLLAIRVILIVFRNYLLIKQSKDFNIRIVNTFFNSLLFLPMSFFDTRRIGELVARLNDTRRIQKVIEFIVGKIIIDVLVCIISICFLFFYSWEIALISLTSLPFYIFLVKSYQSKIISSQKQVMQGYAYSEGNFINSMQGVSTIKANNRESIFQKINESIYGNYQDKIFHLGKINVNITLLSEIFNVFFLISILSFTSYKVYNGTLELGELTAILGISASLLPSVASLAIVTIPINEAKIAFNRMYEFGTEEKEKIGETPILAFSSILIKNLSFRFTGKSSILKSINIELKKSECIAIVGESGSGKSTLGQILQRFYSYEKGQILINESAELCNLNIKEWRELFAVVPQDITIFNGNVVDNILIGAEDTPENILNFIKKYNFEDFIKSLPQGLATIIGEEGVNLSGGQKQMIALMRALYKKPQLLILDEFTSAMDRKTENFVIDLLNNIKEEVSIIFITHRLHALNKIADRIYIIENGETTVNGSHNELLKSNNFYSDFFKELNSVMVRV